MAASLSTSLLCCLFATGPKIELAARSFHPRPISAEENDNGLLKIRSCDAGTPCLERRQERWNQAPADSEADLGDTLLSGPRSKAQGSCAVRPCYRQQAPRLRSRKDKDRRRSCRCRGAKSVHGHSAEDKPTG